MTAGEPEQRPRRPVRLLLPLAAGALLAIALSFVHLPPLGGGPEKAAVSRAAAAPVTVAAVERRDVAVRLETIGRVLALSTVEIKSRVAGEILEAGFSEGMVVERGHLLFRIDPAPFQAALDQALALLARDRAQLEGAEADLKRYEDLAGKGFASVQQLDQTRAAAKALHATVAADEAAVAAARLALGYTEIRAPIAGKTGALLVHPGNLVNAGDSADPLVVITQVEPVRVAFTAPQQDLPAIQAGMAAGGLAARINAPGDPRPAVEGAVDFLGNQVDAATGTIELRATIENPDLRFVPGQFVEVALPLRVLPGALAVPPQALNTGQSGRYVYVVLDDMTVEARPVAVLYDDGEVAAVEGPLAPGERVVTDGQLRLTPGAKVVIAAPEAEGTS